MFTEYILCVYEFEKMAEKDKMNRASVPLVTVSHNNYYYLAFMMKQIRRTEGAPTQVIIMDNRSTDPKMVDYLVELESGAFGAGEPSNNNVVVIRNSTNYGPRINHLNHSELYHSLPRCFILTDSDIQFSPKLPPNFVEIMYNISEHYGAEKVGFALDISEPDLLHDIPNYFMGKSLIEWELQFWERPIEKLWQDRWPLYFAEIDTTFCLVNKSYQNSGVHIRIGGPEFTAKHLPWYRSNSLVDLDKQIEMASQQGGDSTMAGFLVRGGP
jgi:hypothetical protein